MYILGVYKYIIIYICNYIYEYIYMSIEMLGTPTFLRNQSLDPERFWVWLWVFFRSSRKPQHCNFPELCVLLIF